MAKRGRAVSIDRLVKQVSQLDAQRKALLDRIREVVGNVLKDDGTPFPLGRDVDGGTIKQTASRKRAMGGKRRKMSAAARKAISDAQKKRWAKQKAAK
jgi:hypothetical protein